MHPRLLHFLAFTISGTASSAEMRVADPAAFETAVQAAKPGDVIVMRAGKWENADLRFKARGTKEKPITLRAEQLGKTELTGAARLRIGGEHLVVEGLSFVNPQAEDVIDFRVDSKKQASHCRLTQCSLVDDGTTPPPAKEGRWVNFYGVGNRMDHCFIAGKRTRGTTAVVWLGFDPEGRHHIHHNLFGPRSRLGGNGGETLRIGDSKTSERDANCLVEANWFERCNGEAEIISNKSCANLYRHNTFFECQGALTLRHGRSCEVMENAFLGNGAKETGGVRVIGEDHRVVGNWFDRLRGDEFRSAITLVRGIPDSPLNGYMPVKRAVIEKNILMNCAHPLLIGYNDEKEATSGPLDCVYTGNLVQCPDAAKVIEAHTDISTFQWKDNIMTGKDLGIQPTTGIEWKAPELPAKPAVIVKREDTGPRWLAQ
jgi:poly(beta-D-mannuronate) lyase